MDIRIDSLILEVTRRCNMCCPHCLRGDAENMDADIDLIPQIFEGITEVGTLTFSGGEPSLNTKYIMAVVDYVIEHGVRINGCFVATNAKVYSQDLVDCVRRLWEASFRRQKTMCSAAKWLRANSDECELDEFAIAVSGDPYHEEVPVENLVRYLRCGFFSDSKIDDGRFIISRGRGKNLSHAYARDIRNLYIEADDSNLLVSEIYVSCNGILTSDCDMPFEDVDELAPDDAGYIGEIGEGSPLFEVLLGKTISV